MQITNDERNVLWRLHVAGGPLTLRPLGSGPVAIRVFNREIVRVLLSLETRGLLRIGEAASTQISMPGEPVLYTSVAATITAAGREALLRREASATK
jgi:hypothetical protein